MVMDKFEKQFEDLDVQSRVMENSMGNSTTLTTPQDQVERLMMQVADEHGLELHMEIPNAPSSQAVANPSALKDQDQLSERLSKLRNP